VKFGVVGAGLMGSEIALVYAMAGYDVVLTDKNPAALAEVLPRLTKTLDKGIERGFYTAETKTETLKRLAVTSDLASFAGCGMITEAVFEDLGVKQTVLAALDKICAPDCIFATNTSTIPISTLAASVSEARRPRFIGTHYFSPVSRMKLVEIIPAFSTTPDVVEAVRAHCVKAGKTPVLIKDVTGFAVNRVLHAFIIEAVRLVEEGVATPEDIDIACRLGLGHPMGPFELMDATTSSLCLQAQDIMFNAYGERFRPRPLLKQRVQAGLVGGRGKPGWRR
jgi:3-hydroxybutyryl-CoA dehydrogenase